MRLIRYEYAGSVSIGMRVKDGIVPTGYTDMITLINAGESVLQAAETLKDATHESGVLREEEVRLLAPLVPGKLLFSGLNYRSHLQENPGATLPSYPQFFAKLPSAVIGPGEPIRIPEAHSQVDYEVELACIIGKEARKVPRKQAFDYIFGYTIVNDVSGRDVQFTDNQITTGKGFDTFCPMGPELVLRDEIPDPSQLHVASYVNDEPRQSSSTADMLFPIDELIAFLSAHITLYPGDLISTGTPAGVGCFRHPPLYLRPGDHVTVAVDRIGRLTNPVEAGWDQA